MENTNQTTKKFNPAHAQAIMELLAKSPFYDLIDMDMVAIEPGYARVDLEVTKRHHNPFGQIHGGVFASLFDVTTYWAQYADAPLDEGYVTLDLLVNDLHTTHLGKVICEAHAVNESRHVFLSEGTIKTQGGTLLATGISKLYCSAGISPVEDALKKLDPTIVLPPKYLEA